jgi:hypothetical protein
MCFLKLETKTSTYKHLKLKNINVYEPSFRVASSIPATLLRKIFTCALLSEKQQFKHERFRVRFLAYSVPHPSPLCPFLVEFPSVLYVTLFMSINPSSIPLGNGSLRPMSTLGEHICIVMYVSISYCIVISLTRLSGTIIL